MTTATSVRAPALSTRTWRTVLVWLHALTSFAWMTQALTLALLVTAAVLTSDPGFRVGAMEITTLIDSRMLGPLANASAFTGFMLAATTPWGFFRHWWVLVKFLITLVQLYIGIFLLSDGLHEALSTAKAGNSVSWWPCGVGSVLMGTAVAFQGWVSLAKPWAKTRWINRGPRKLPTAAPLVFVTSALAVVGDVTLSQIAGFPCPVLELIVLIGYLPRRASRLRTQSRSGKDSPRRS